VHVRHTKHAAH